MIVIDNSYYNNNKINEANYYLLPLIIVSIYSKPGTYADIFQGGGG